MDNNPFEATASQLKTSPPTNTTPIYRQRPATLGQIGRATSYVSIGESFTSAIKPHYYQLAAWDEARRKEPIIKDGIDKIVLSVISKIGDYVHPDPSVNDFVNANLHSLKRWVAELTSSSYWSGFGVSEIIWERREGPKGIDQVWIDDIISYHPSQVEFKLNLHGRLTHGEKLPTDTLRTGIWVPSPPDTVAYKPRSDSDKNGNRIRLPRSKVIHTCLGGEGNNPYGTSQLIPVLQYHLFKEAFKDMMAVALDRYGTPLIYAVVPPQSTSEQVQEPDGSLRSKSYREVVAESLSDLRSETAIVFEQINKDHPVKLEALTTGNNYADAFKEAIDMCDHNMMVGLGIPNLIVRDTRSGLGSGSSAENQVQMFHTFISSIFDVVINDFINYAITQLISYNFDIRNRSLSSSKGHIKKIPFRFADLLVLGDVIKNWTELGYINPSNQEDFNQVRSYLELPQRKVDSVAHAGAGIIIESARPSPQSPGSIQPSTPNSSIFNKQRINPISEDPNKTIAAKEKTKTEKLKSLSSLFSSSSKSKSSIPK